MADEPNSTVVKDVESLCREFRGMFQSLRNEVGKVIVGHLDIVDGVLISLFAGGHVLLEGVPGLGKTLLVRTLAAALALKFRRIQFTPDLLPGDITGGYVYDRVNSSFELRQGPIFANVILADEINRASPKTQSALLEAMQEYQVTLEGETMKLPQPFIVMATQNPIEYEGTFPLPEAQLDRFLIKLSVGYPAQADEQEMLRRRRERMHDEFDLQQVTGAVELQAVRSAVEQVHVDADIERYVVALVAGTRGRRQVAVGASPRGSLALLKLSRAWAAMQGRDYVLPDDVKLFVLPALTHRLILEPELWMKRRAAEEILETVLQSTPVPVQVNGR